MEFKCLSCNKSPSKFNKRHSKFKYCTEHFNERSESDDDSSYLDHFELSKLLQDSYRAIEKKKTEIIGKVYKNCLITNERIMENTKVILDKIEDSFKIITKKIENLSEISEITKYIDKVEVIFTDAPWLDQIEKIFINNISFKTPEFPGRKKRTKKINKNVKKSSERDSSDLNDDSRILSSFDQTNLKSLSNSKQKSYHFRNLSQPNYTEGDKIKYKNGNKESDLEKSFSDSLSNINLSTLHLKNDKSKVQGNQTDKNFKELILPKEIKKTKTIKPIFDKNLEIQRDIRFINTNINNLKKKNEKRNQNFIQDDNKFIRDDLLDFGYINAYSVINTPKYKTRHNQNPSGKQLTKVINKHDRIYQQQLKSNKSRISELKKESNF